MLTGDSLQVLRYSDGRIMGATLAGVVFPGQMSGRMSMNDILLIQQLQNRDQLYTQVPPVRPVMTAFGGPSTFAASTTPIGALPGGGGPLIRDGDDERARDTAILVVKQFQRMGATSMKVRSLPDAYAAYALDFDPGHNLEKLKKVALFIARRNGLSLLWAGRDDGGYSAVFTPLTSAASRALGQESDDVTVVSGFGEQESSSPQRRAPAAPWGFPRSRQPETPPKTLQSPRAIPMAIAGAILGGIIGKHYRGGFATGAVVGMTLATAAASLMKVRDLEAPTEKQAAELLQEEIPGKLFNGLIQGPFLAVASTQFKSPIARLIGITCGVWMSFTSLGSIRYYNDVSKGLISGLKS